MRSAGNGRRPGESTDRVLVAADRRRRHEPQPIQLNGWRWATRVDLGVRQVTHSTAPLSNVFQLAWLDPTGRRALEALFAQDYWPDLDATLYVDFGVACSDAYPATA